MTGEQEQEQEQEQEREREPGVGVRGKRRPALAQLAHTFIDSQCVVLKVSWP